MLQRMLRSHGAGRHRKPGKHKAAASAAEADHVAGQLASDLDVSVRVNAELQSLPPMLHYMSQKDLLCSVLVCNHIIKQQPSCH